MKFVIALWQRESSQFLATPMDNKLSKLEDAVKLAATRGFAHVKSSLGAGGFHSIFLAPEYFHTALNAGKMEAGQFNTRSVYETEKNEFVEKLRNISTRSKSILIIPGTIAWKKRLNRSYMAGFKKDKETGVRTDVPKSKTRTEKAIKSLDDYQSTFGTHNPQNTGSTALKSSIMQHVMIDVLKLCTEAEFGARGAALLVANKDRITSETRKLLDDKTKLVASGIASADEISRHLDIVKTVDEKKQMLTDGTARYVGRNTAYVLLNGDVKFKYNKVGDYHEAIGDGSTVFTPGTYTGYFEQGGIGIGLEVCLDHAYGVLAETLKTRLPGKTPQIHLLVSDSTTNRSDNVSIASGYLSHGGFFAHASTNPAATGVYYKQLVSGNIVKMTPITKTDTVDGGILSYYELEL